MPFPPLTQVVLCPAPTQDLNFGQLVQIFEEYGGEDGWYRGRLFGDTQGASEPLGIFPKKYVAIKVLCPTPPTPRACVSARASARAALLTRQCPFFACRRRASGLAMGLLRQ